MNTLRRLTPVVWVIGVAALAVSLIGAAGGLDARSETDQSTDSRQKEETLGVVCFGTVDIEGGLLELRPPTFPQPSRVTEIHPSLKEGGTIEPGQWLVRFDNVSQRLTLQKAQHAIDEARGKLAQVEEERRMALEEHKHLGRIQQAVVQAKEHELAAAKAQLDQLKDVEAKARERGVRLTNEFEMEAAEQKWKALSQAVEAERRKLAQIDDMMPDFSAGIVQAEAAIKRYEVERELAQYALDLTELTAPTQAVVLRSNVRVGMQFGPQVQEPAVILLPKESKLIVRAEVDQEFAHRVQVGQPVELYSAKGLDVRWSGNVTQIDEAYLPERSAGKFPNPFQSDQARPLGFNIALSRVGDAPPKVGQRLRLKVHAP